MGKYQLGITVVHQTFGQSITAQVEKQLNVMLKAHNPPKPEDKGNTQGFHLQPLEISISTRFTVVWMALEPPIKLPYMVYWL
jgi:hypothetical protein